MTTTDVRGGGPAGAVAAEWTKFWSVRATWWCLIAGTALLVPIDGHGAADRGPHRFWCGGVR